MKRFPGVRAKTTFGPLALDNRLVAGAVSLDVDDRKRPEADLTLDCVNLRMPDVRLRRYRVGALALLIRKFQFPHHGLEARLVAQRIEERPSLQVYQRVVPYP